MMSLKFILTPLDQDQDFRSRNYVESQLTLKASVSQL